jgi:hypothetical protein
VYATSLDQLSADEIAVLRVQARESIEPMRWAHHGLVFGNDFMGLHGALKTDSEQAYLLFNDACTTRGITKNIELGGCEAFENGVFTHGLHAAVEHYNHAVLQEAISVSRVSNDGMVYSQNYDRIAAMGVGYLDDALAYSSVLYQEKTESDIGSFIRMRKTLAALFSVVLILTLFTVYLPLISELHSDTNRTRAMLLTIPSSVIDSVKSIRMYIRSSAV